MKLRAAIAGAGLMGFWHAKNIARTGGTVAGVFDRDSAAAQRLARRFRGASAGTSLSDVLAGGKIDVLHVCTPADSHLDLAAEAFGRGIHVMLEKPMAESRPATERLYALAAEHRISIFGIAT